MKNIFIKKFVLIFFSIFLLSIAAFFACKKIEEGSNPSKSSNHLSQFYNSNLIESFKKESVAKEFLQEVSQTPIKVVNGILSFNSVEDLNRVYDLIIEYNDKYDDLVFNDERYSKYAQPEQMPDYIMAFLFESKLGFYSLRAEIEEKLIPLERGNGVPDNDDPDDHYIVSPYMRSLLTPQCELIIDDLICVYYDDYGIGIMNLDWTTLQELHENQRKNNFDEKKALEFCAGKTNAFFLTTGSEPSLHVDFIMIPDPKNPKKIKFVNYSCSEAYKNMQYLWDFGNGVTSTEKDPTYTFPELTSGTSACLIVNLPASSKGQTTGSVCTSVPLNPVEGGISYKENDNGEVGFSLTNVNTFSVVLVTWDFGDNSVPQQIGASIYASHTYSENGNYNVTAEILYNDMFTRETLTKTIQVKKLSSGGTGGGGGGNCCAKSIDREVTKEGNPYTHNGEKRKVKQVIRVTNILGFHRIAATTKNLYQKSNGNWAARKVDEINVGAKGIIYWQDDDCNNCQCPYLYNLWKGGETSATVNPKKNASEVVMDRGTDGFSFKVGPKTLWSQHYIKDGGQEYMNGTGIVAVHDKNCSNN